MTRSFLGLVALFGAGLLAGCGEEDLDGDGIDAAPADDGFLDEQDARGNGQFTFYTVRQDLRMCASPMCGGVFVNRLNRSNTVCANGSKAAECYAASMDLSRLSMTAGQQATFDAAWANDALIVRGLMRHYVFNGIDYGRFVVTEAWIGQTGTAPVERYWRVTDNGIACFTDPCPHLDEKKLDSLMEDEIADLDFGPSGATTHQQDKAWLATTDPEGLIVSGYRSSVTGPGGTYDARAVHEFYTLFAN